MLFIFLATNYLSLFFYRLLEQEIACETVQLNFIILQMAQDG